MSTNLTAGIGALCSGIGGLAAAVSNVFGLPILWQSEIDPNASQALALRMGHPNLGDLTAVDWTEVERPEVMCFGFPCSDLSIAGKGAGIVEGNRSGLFFDCWASVRILRPRYVVLENVPAIFVRRPGIDVVADAMARDGYDFRWLCLRASDVGACHRRKRWFCVATDSTCERLQRDRGARDSGRFGHGNGAGVAGERAGDFDWREYEPAIRRHELVFGRPAPHPVDGEGRLASRFVEWMMMFPDGWVSDVLPRSPALKALGNAVVQRQAETALRMLLQIPTHTHTHTHTHWPASLLPTPAARDWKDTGNLSNVPVNSLLPRVVNSLSLSLSLLPTPRVSMAHGPSQAETDAGDPKRRLETTVAYLADTTPLCLSRQPRPHG